MKYVGDLEVRKLNFFFFYLYAFHLLLHEVAIFPIPLIKYLKLIWCRKNCQTLYTNSSLAARGRPWLNKIRSNSFQQWKVAPSPFFFTCVNSNSDSFFVDYNTVEVRDLQESLNRGCNSEYTEDFGEYSRRVKYHASESRKPEWEVKTLTLALSIPKPTVSLAYIHSSRLATRVMATLPSCETTWERKWRNCPPVIAEKQLQRLRMTCASYHAVHEYEFELVFVEGLVAVLVVGRPDVAGDGGCHSCVGVPVTRVSQKRTLIIQ